MGRMDKRDTQGRHRANNVFISLTIVQFIRMKEEDLIVRPL